MKIVTVRKLVSKICLRFQLDYSSHINALDQLEKVLKIVTYNLPKVEDDDDVNEILFVYLDQVEERWRCFQCDDEKMDRLEKNVLYDLQWHQL